MTGTARIASALALVLAALLVGCAAPSPTALDGISDSGMRSSFDDEFDGPAGARPNPASWLPDEGGTGWGNKELQYYSRGDNTYLDGQGHLVIEARTGSGGHSCWYGACRYTSGKLTTRQPERVAFAQQYGRFEARIKMPEGNGLLPAFWLLGQNIDAAGYPGAGEIDVVETLGQQLGNIEQHAHGPGLQFGSATKLPPGQSAADWHTYAVQWTAQRIDWQVDGATTQSLIRDPSGASWVFDHPFYLLLTLAVGGEWPGDPDGATAFPARMLVDYVRVYAATGTS